jgi:inorganic phosphate transporter, PiT family
VDTALGFPVLVGLIAVALLFDFLNGLHDAANSIATIVSTRVLRPHYALRITKLTPMQGFCAETGGAATLFMATFFGVPVSTTHTITGAIVGVGAARRASAVRWNVAASIVYAWVITVPAAALLAALTYRSVLLLRR